MALEEKTKASRAQALEDVGANEKFVWELGAIGAWPLPSCNIVHGKILMADEGDCSLHITFTEGYPFEAVDLLYFADFIIPEAQRRVREFSHWYQRYMATKQRQNSHKPLCIKTSRRI